MGEEFEEFENTEQDVVGEQEEPETEPQQEKLWAGKYKTPEEMEAGYKEAQSAMTKAQQELAELRQRQANQPVDNYSTSQNPNAWIDQFNEQVFENPAQQIMGLVGNIISESRRIQKAAEANVKRELAQFASDPLYQHISGDLEAFIANVPDEQLADPNTAKQAVEMAFNLAAGQYARRTAGAARQNPAERQQFLQSLGMNAPQSDGDRPGADTVFNERDNAMLTGLGLNNEQIARAKKRYIEKQEEELY